MQRNTEDPSLGELFANLSRETTTLVREEVALAKSEVSQKASRLGKDLGFLVAGAAVAYAAFLSLIAAAIILLALALKLWLSALIITAIVGVVAYFLIQKGIADLKRGDIAPARTMETVREDVEWARRQTR